jgi:hypothetical protein
MGKRVELTYQRIFKVYALPSYSTLWLIDNKIACSFGRAGNKK